MSNITVFRKGIAFSIMFLFILVSLAQYAGTTSINSDGLTNYSQETIQNSSDDIEINIFAGFFPFTKDPTEPSLGVGVTIEVINNLSEGIWIYYQENHYTLKSGEPLDLYGGRSQFPAPPNSTYPVWHSGGTPIPCRITITVQADLVKYISRSGFQFLRFIYFPGEK